MFFVVGVVLHFTLLTLLPHEGLRGASSSAAGDVCALHLHTLFTLHHVAAAHAAAYTGTRLHACAGGINVLRSPRAVPAACTALTHERSYGI